MAHACHSSAQLVARPGPGANTVARAYRELEAEGLVASRVRHGTMVAARSATSPHRGPPAPDPGRPVVRGPHTPTRCQGRRCRGRRTSRTRTHPAAQELLVGQDPAHCHAADRALRSVTTSGPPSGRPVVADERSSPRATQPLCGADAEPSSEEVLRPLSRRVGMVPSSGAAGWEREECCGCGYGRSWRVIRCTRSRCRAGMRP